MFELSQAHHQAKTRYEEIAGPLPKAMKDRLPALPEMTAFHWDASRACVNAIGEARTELAAQRAGLSRQMLFALTQLERMDRETLQLEQSVHGLRASSANIIAQSMASLGTTSEDEVTVQLRRLQQDLTTGKEMLEQAQGRLEKLEQIRGTFTSGTEGAKMIEKVSGQLGTIGKVLEFTATNGERLLAIRDINAQLNNPRTALQGMGKLLEFVGPLGQSVPVRGPAIGAMLQVYAQAAAACGVAAVNIQEKLIQKEISILRPAPELRLYRAADLALLQNDGAVERAVTMLQVRRLLHLIHCTPEASREAPAQQ
jgi:hypothetical protein